MSRPPPTSPSRAGTTRHRSSPRTSPATTPLGTLARIGLFAGTILVIITLALLPLLTPWFIHPALDAAGSAGRLGLTTAQTYALSDRSVEELVLGPGSFTIAGPGGEPFYDADERSHLGEARLLLGLLLAAGGLALVGITAALARRPDRRAAIWTVIGRAGLASAIAVSVLGLVSLIAFDSLFRLFHQIFFPGGNWSFDPATQRLVQLYPFAFWQIAAGALGTLVVLLGLLTWLAGRRLGARGRPDRTLDAASG